MYRTFRLPQKMARDLKNSDLEVDELYYQCSEDKCADQLRGYRSAYLCLGFTYAKNRFSHDSAQMVIVKH